MEKLPWNPSKDVIRVSANNLGIDIDRAIYTAMAIDYSRQSTERAEKNDIVRFGMCSVNIRKVVFNDPATIVFWSDNTKTVVKCGPDDIFDKEKGLALAIVKKMAGNDNRFHKVFKQWCKPDGMHEVAITSTQVLKELNKMAAQTKDGITGLLTEAYMAIHRGYSAADKNEKK